MRSRLALIALVGLLAGAAVAGLSLPLMHGSKSGSGRTSEGKALVGGPFNLTDHNGHTVTDRDFRGRYMLVYFGYTFCPDVCPAGLQVMSAALDQLGAEADRVVPLFVSLDPARDTPEKLAEYVKSFGPRLIGLTGTPDEIAKLARAYRVYYKKVDEPKAPQNYTLDHTSIIYLMAPNGEFITHFTHATKADELAARLRQAL